MNLFQAGLLSLLHPSSPDGDVTEDSKTRGTEREIIRCAACSHEVTAPNTRINVAGNHQHSFFNPLGIVYQIGCFSAATGVVGVGLWSAEFSWFAGYHWRITACANCQIHLGWGFKDGDSSFFGLILNKLAE